MAPVRITISDDHSLLRTGLRAIISDRDGLEVVGEAQGARETLALLREVKPDVAVVDVSMRDASAISVLPALRETSRSTRFLLLTMHGDTETVRAALAAGAHGYLSKEAHHEEVVAAIRTLAQGRSYVSVPVGDEGLASLVHNDQMPATPSSPARPLSSREREVLGLFAQGRTHREIAAALGVRLKTVETYRSRLGDKLGARTKAELVHWARVLGIVPASDDEDPAATLATAAS